MNSAKEKHFFTAAQLRRMALLTALGVVLHRVETLIPLPSPWIKLGLANIITLLALVTLGLRGAWIVTVSRVFLASVLGGAFLSPTFFLSLAGACASLAVMGGLFSYGKPVFSMVGISIAGAYTHVTAVFFLVYFLIVRQESFFYLLPVFLGLSLASGIITGTLANSLVRAFLSTPRPAV
jgi:heptaprenyl diphosphate synthase